MFRTMTVSFPILSPYMVLHLIMKGINGISKIKDGYNPSTWMLELTSAAQEAALGVNFTEEYKNSELYR